MNHSKQGRLLFGVVHCQGSAAPQRTLRLLVAWSTVSTQAAAGFVLKKDDVIERDEAALQHFEVIVWI